MVSSKLQGVMFYGRIPVTNTVHAPKGTAPEDPQEIPTVLLPAAPGLTW